MKNEKEGFIFILYFNIFVHPFFIFKIKIFQLLTFINFPLCINENIFYEMTFFSLIFLEHTFTDYIKKKNNTKRKMSYLIRF